MAENTKIEWVKGSDGTQGATWNPITGCTVHSAGCTNCYAMKLAWRLQAMANAGNDKLAHYQGTVKKVNGKPVWTGRLDFSDNILLAPLRRKKPTRYFVDSMSDLFHQYMPDDWIDRIFAVAALCPQHTFQVLTKRSARMREYLSDPRTPERIAKLILACDRANWPVTGEQRLAPLGNRAKEKDLSFVILPLPNVWLGVSVENQAAADERIPDLLATPAAIRWISAEPLLGPVDLTTIPAPDQLDGKTFEEGWSFNSLDTGDYYSQRSENTFGEVFYSGGDGPDREHALDWVVAGGESGTGARPMHPDWARSLRDQCAAAGTPFFFKQWGEWRIADQSLGAPPKTQQSDFWRVGKKAAGRLLDGVEHNGMPA